MKSYKGRYFHVKCEFKKKNNNNNNVQYIWLTELGKQWSDHGSLPWHKEVLIIINVPLMLAVTVTHHLIYSSPVTHLFVLGFTHRNKLIFLTLSPFKKKKLTFLRFSTLTNVKQSIMSQCVSLIRNGKITSNRQLWPSHKVRSIKTWAG